MSRPLAVSVCRACGRTLFPSRVLCPGCGGASWRREPAEEGVVEEVTVAGDAGGAPVRLATVRLDSGPVVVAGLGDELGPGARVQLVAVAGAPVGRSRSATRRP